MLTIHRVLARLLTILLLASGVSLVGIAAAPGSSATDHAEAPAPPHRTSLAAEVLSEESPTATISGLVYDESGELVDGVLVEALLPSDPDGEPIASDYTYEYENSESHGAYTLHVPAGAYLVRFSSHPYDEYRVFETSYYGGGAGTEVTAADGQDRLLDDVTLVEDTGAPVTGTVTDGDGTPMAGVDVSLYRVTADDWWSVDWTTTNASGQYTFEGVNRNRGYTVGADGEWLNDHQDHLGYPDVFLGQKPAPLPATTFTLPARSAGTSLQAIRLVPGVTVSGSLQRADQTPVPHTHFQFYVVEDGQAYGLGDVHSDLSEEEEGRFEASLLPGSVYTVGATDYELDWSGQDYVFLGDTYDLTQAETFDLVAGAPVELEPLTLVEDPTARYVSGTVVGESGGSFEANVLGFNEEAGWETVAGGYADEEGNFRLTLRAWALEHYTAFTIRASDDGGEADTTYLGDVTDVEDAVTFPAPAAGETHAAGTITLRYTRPAFTGAVLRGGEPVSGVRVWLYGHHPESGWDAMRSAVTGADGAYTLRVPWWVGTEGYTEFTIMAEGTAGYGDAYLGGAGSLEEATTLPEPETGTTVPVDDLVQQPRPGLVSGKVSTSDGGSLGSDYELETTLFRWVDYEWTEEEGDGYWSEEDWSYASDTMSYQFDPVQPGTYTVATSAWPSDGPRRYATTYANGTGIEPTGPGAPGTFEVLDAEGPTAGPEVVLQKGVTISGTVTGGAGRLADVYVAAHAWGPHGPASSIDSTWTDENGSYTLLVPPGSSVWITASRTGYDDYHLGGEAWPTTPNQENTLVVTDDTSLSFSMAADWGAIGSVAGVPDEFCLSRSDGYIEFHGHELYASDFGYLFDYAAYEQDDFGPFDARDRDPLLAVMTSTWASVTWGLSPDGSELCVQWQQDEWGNGLTAQLRMTPAAGGGFDVTYAYDAVPRSLANENKAGFTEGEGEAGQVMLFHGWSVEDGYADSNTETGLIHNSLNSQTPGEYRFHFDGFNERGDAPENLMLPSFEGSTAPGGTLTADPGTWSVDGVETSDLEFTYTWRWGNGRVVQAGSDATYVLQDTDAGRNLRVRVCAKPAWHRIGCATSDKAFIGFAAATNSAPPTITPGDGGKVGTTFTADPGTWTPAEGLTSDQLSFSYTWYADGDRVGRGPSYTATHDDAGVDLTVRVRVTASGYAPVTADSQSVPVAELEALGWASAPALSGVPRVGSTLVLDQGTVDAEGVTPSFAVKWKSGILTRSPDPDTFGLEFTPKANDAGRLVTVKVTASAPGYRSVTWATTVGPVADAAASVAALTIRVRTTGGETVPGSWVTVCDEDADCLGAEVDQDGDHVTSGAAGSTYRVTATPPSGSGLVAKTVPVNMPGDGSPLAMTVTVTAPPTPPTNVGVPGNVGTPDQPTIVPGQDQTFVVTGCATTPSPTYSVQFPDGTTATGPMAKGATTGELATFTASLPAWQVPTSQFVFKTNIPADCDSGTPATEVTVFIDPSGIVTDQYGRPLVGASVTLLRAENLADAFVAVADGDETVMDPEVNTNNPSLTDGTGYFRWDVTAGWYKVRAAAANCSPATTAPMQVPPERVGLLIKLQCDAPAPTSSPTITGQAEVGETLETSTAGWASILEPSVQWLRNGVAIDGATSPTYTLTAADVDQKISVRQTAVRPDFVQEEGRGTPVSFTEVEAVSEAKTVSVGDAPTGSVSIAGTPAVGRQLSAQLGTWSVGGLTPSYTWLAGSSVLGTGPTYTVKATDAGSTIRVRVVVSRPGYSSGTATSAGATVAKLQPSIQLSLKKKLKAKKGVATVVIKAAGLAPTGTVVIFDGKKKIASAPAKAVTSIKLTKLKKKGSHKLTASYLGDSRLLSAVSRTVKVKVV